MTQPRLSSPIVSVIVPTRNRAHVIRRAMDSALGQTFDDLELIVVDDGSDDETKDIVTGVRDSRVRYIQSEVHRGAPAARNTGIRAAKGQYLAFHDSDDEWLPVKLERQLELLNRHAPDAAVATCGTQTRRNDVVRPVNATRERVPYEALLAFRDRPWASSTLMVKRTRATEGVLFDESLPSGQDWDYLVRLARVTGVVSVREPLVRIDLGSGHRISTARRKLEGSRLLREKYNDELRRHPQALAAHEGRLCRLCFALGDTVNGRRHLANALKAAPLDFEVLKLVGYSFPMRPLVRRILGAYGPSTISR